MIGLQCAGFGAAKMPISRQACAKAKAPGAKVGSGKTCNPRRHIETCAACSIVLQNCSIGNGCACTRQVRTDRHGRTSSNRMAEGTSPTTRVGAEAGSQPATIVAGLAVLLIALVLAASMVGAYPLSLADMLAARRADG